MMGRHSKKHGSRFYSLILTLLSAMVVAAYLILPGMWQWSHAAAKVEAKKIHQVDTVPGPVDEKLVAQLRNVSTSTQTGPVIITYHDIGHNESPYTVTPENFATQMRMIHESGWVTLTVDQVDAWLNGQPVPPHSVMITFDDGAMGVWQYAEPILKRYNMNATAFIITGFVGTHYPYYMDWDKITELANTGRWDIEAHTHLGHVEVPSGPDGAKGPFLTTVQWIPELGRAETLEEYRLRITTDLAECRHQLITHNFPVPRFFAFPFSADKGTPEGTDILRQTVTSLYRAAMLDDADDVVATSSTNVERGLVRRMDITAAVTPQHFVDKIEGGSPLDPPAAQPMSEAGPWTEDKGQQAGIETTGTTVTINPDLQEKVVRNYALVRSAQWTDYTVTAAVGGFSVPADGSQAGISVLKPPGWANEQEGRIDVTVYGDAYSVQGLVTLPEQPLVDAPMHHVVIDVTDVQVIITVDNTPPTVINIPPHDPRTVGGGMALYAYRQSDTNPPLTFSNLTIS